MTDEQRAAYEAYKKSQIGGYPPYEPSDEEWQAGESSFVRAVMVVFNAGREFERGLK